MNDARVKIVVIFLFAVFCFGGGSELLSCNPNFVPSFCWKDAISAFFDPDVLWPSAIIVMLSVALIFLHRFEIDSGGKSKHRF